MTWPNLKEEKKLWKNNFKLVVGLDEAGRGPLAGPVVAAAVLINSQSNFKSFPKGIRDSKQLTAKKREALLQLLICHPDLKWGIGKVSEKKIDRINILEATKLAMKKAIDDLSLKLKKENSKIDFLLLDGNFKIEIDIPQRSIIKADQKVFSCAIASIFAKVSRDKIMEKYAKKFPNYAFERHKGYPTRYHFKVLREYGPSVIHRKTFQPVKRFFT